MQKGYFLLAFLVKPAYRGWRHLLLALFIISMLYNRGQTFYVEPVSSYGRVAVFVILLLLCYLNMYLLVPRLLLKNEYLKYCLCVSVLIVALQFLSTIVIHLLTPYLISPVRGDVNINFWALVLLLIAATAAIKLFQRWVLDTQRISELEKMSLQSELDQLKNQINPHFLFNMLNNANVLVQRDPEKASQVLMKLSDLLRYQLYDCSRDKVLLTADIHFLTDFLNLEKIRRDHFEFIVSKQGDISGVQVPPLLFIVFVENAVKHNVDDENQSYVHLYFEVHNKDLHFKCVNSKPRATVQKKKGGLGLANIRRTLELSYPGRHHLLIEEGPGTFSTDLKILL